MSNVRRCSCVTGCSSLRAHNPADADAAVTVLGLGAPPTDIALPYDPDA